MFGGSPTSGINTCPNMSHVSRIQNGTGQEIKCTIACVVQPWCKKTKQKSQAITNQSLAFFSCGP